jgi:hypothetical protein
MLEMPSAREVAAALEPQLPGRTAARNIPDAIVEPEWGGLGAFAALTGDDAALFAHGEEVAAPEELIAALRDAFRAVGAVIEGRVTTKALETGVGMAPSAPKVERPPLLIPKGLVKSGKDDPYVKQRKSLRESQAVERSILEALAEGERHVFVATDLLWLDGTSLLDVPLLERKRQLETVLAESFLVRVTAFVRASAIPTLVAWGTLGFGEISYRSANSRYRPGRDNPDWAISGPPEGTLRPANAPAPSR